jgi:hypothetical protein
LLQLVTELFSSCFSPKGPKPTSSIQSHFSQAKTDSHHFKLVQRSQN